MTLTTPEGREIHSALEEAIYLRLGGAVTACHRLEVSTQAIYKLLATGYVSNRSLAVKLEGLTGIPAAELMKLAPWRGTERNPPSGPPERRRRRPKPSSLRPVPLPTPPSGAGGAEVQAKGKHTCPTCHKSACNKFCNPVDSFVPEYKRTGTEG